MYSSNSRQNGFRDLPRSPNGLPIFSSSIHEKKLRHAKATSWTVSIFLPIPGLRRHLRLVVPNLSLLYQFAFSHFSRRRGTLVLLLACVSIIFTVYAVAQRFGQRRSSGGSLFTAEPSTLVFGRENLQKIWQWEIQSGHYPSSRDIPKAIGLTVPPLNPALHPRKVAKIPSRFRPPGAAISETVGHGPKRVYLDIQARAPNVAYPPRPVPGSVADLDIIMNFCDYSTAKFVRDCLEVLRIGGGLDNGARLRRGNVDDWRYIYLEDQLVEKPVIPVTEQAAFDPIIRPSTSIDPNAGLPKKPWTEWELPLQLPPPLEHRPYHTLPSTCDPDNPRLFHMFWTGPFTDKPYLALSSFLFTQNLRLHLHEDEPDTAVCRPQFWLWINPGPAAAVPNPNALHDMFEQLKSKQLDGVPELKDEWRGLKDKLFNSGGHIIPVHHDDDSGSDSMTTSGDSGTATVKGDDDEMLKRQGSKSADSYDRLSVILSDMARFVLCHRFGGVYLDADTIFLRDWEELWGWKGAFAYRWSRLEKYNTAVLRMNKGSALGSFLFRTALKNGLDFHPMTVSKYTKDAYLEGLLLRLPDALFDSAWLNTEYFQRDRPPQPYFTEFGDFFDTPPQNSAAPQALGFEGFFRGAYSYHFHNFWWKPFDPTRNFPDLGPQFAEGERIARLKNESSLNTTHTAQETTEKVTEDKRDLDWATVLKRTFEAYIRGERPNMYGEWLQW
ncbi:glycosyltransferase family 32 protein [Lactarius sanguifluus]|nr:glycosyltransferase family 32 protein [Lactarius sanguifluus]